MFSPHTWGWPAGNSSYTPAPTVLPTHVGMARRECLYSPDGIRSPHTRGDGPSRLFAERKELWFSPHTWGWPEFQQGLPVMQQVLPTHVGMARQSTLRSATVKRSPHTRGDGPTT